jgi:DNA-binding NtrC family response regulator
MSRADDEETDFDPSGPASTHQLVPNVSFQGFTLSVHEGQDVGKSWVSNSASCSVGSHPSNDLVLSDRRVSKFHCEVRLHQGMPRVHDLKSRNGTVVDGVRVVDAFLRNGSTVRIGQTSIGFHTASHSFQVPLSTNTSFERLVGRSTSMRAMFAMLELAADSDATVLLEGETGTGKEATAQSIHDASPRRDQPFVVVDCGAIPSNLLESELFGHERGAFTGAVDRRQGAITEGQGGTVFLDEVGELPVELQPKVLRVLEQRVVRSLGATAYRKIDVRFIAATNRKLRTEVNEGRFRPDLFYRLAVINISLPALQQRPEDIPLLVDHFLEALGADKLTATSLATPEFLARLQNAAWPGNVRELRNYLERCLVLKMTPPLDAEGLSPTSTREHPVDMSKPYAEARQSAIEEFEKRYIETLLSLHKGNVAAAAEAAGISKVYLYKLIRRHRLNSSP